MERPTRRIRDEHDLTQDARRDSSMLSCFVGRLVICLLFVTVLPGCVSPAMHSFREQVQSPSEVAREVTAVIKSSASVPSVWLVQLTNAPEGPPLIRLLAPVDDNNNAVGNAWPHADALLPSQPLPPLTLPGGSRDVSLGSVRELERPHDTPESEPRSLVSRSDSRPVSLWDSIESDHRNFYSCESLTWLGVGFAGGAVVANTSMDAHFFDFFRENVRDAKSDDWAKSLHLNKEIGNGLYTLPLFGTAAIAGRVFDDFEPARLAGEWGDRSLRTFLVGAPPLIATQLLTGASRPFEISKTEHNSHWHPFQDDNGVSGHAFMGAIPFLSAAKMVENPWARGVLYFGSTLPGLSRINDGAHYGSQVALGWWLAFLAAEAVDDTHDELGSWKVVPLPLSSGQGIGVEWRW